MRTCLLHPDRPLETAARLPPHADDLARDLGLDVIVETMARGDEHAAGVVRRVLLTPLADPVAIRYRQAVLADALAHPAVVRELHALATEAIAGEARVWGAFLDQYPEPVLGRATAVLELFLGVLRRLRRIASQHVAEFESAGFRQLCRQLEAELDDAYLATLDDHLERLKLRDGIVATASLGPGNRGDGYVLRKPRAARTPFRQRMAAAGGPVAEVVLDRSAAAYQVPDDNDALIRDLNELKARAIASVATALAESTDHILGFFRALRAELAWYVGGINLHERLAERGVATCVPDALPAGEPRLRAAGLVDLPLAILLPPGEVVPNDVDADRCRLVVVTGANRGGKSTFLRSLGQAQVMLQAGLFVAARSFAADLRDGVFSHFRREEDPELERGKLDEELARMGQIVDALHPGSLLLLNESFASTNEREGAAIGREVVEALVEAGVKVVLVTHLFDLAAALQRAGTPDGRFLRAEREPDGRRTFRIIEAAPLATSFAADIYRNVFGSAPGGMSLAPGPQADETARES